MKFKVKSKSGTADNSNDMFRGRKNLWLSILKGSFSFLILTLEALNPDSYRTLIKKNFKRAFSYFSILILLCLFILFVVNIKGILSFPNELNSTISKFTSFKFNPDIKAPQDVNFNYNIVYTPTDRNISNENMLLTNDIINIKEPCLSLIPFYCSLKEEKVISEPYSEFFDLKSNSDLITTLKILIIILIPTLFILIYLFLFIKFLLIILTIAILGSVFLTIFKKRAPFKDLLKISLYSSTVFIVASMFSFNYSYRILPLLGLLIYITLFMIGIIINYFDIDF